MASCIFCEILSGWSAASIIYRDDTCTALLTIEPVNEGHALVIPNAHHVNIFDLPPSTAGHMFKVAQQIAKSYGNTDIRCDGVNIVMCNGAAASQTVFHAHIHVNPRHVGDGFSWNLPPGFDDPANRDELNRVAAKLALVLGAAS
ncbi:HIT family protein [Lysobacter sp. H23M47]|uniref:HIT family protein n=1 Tax=Lysobacter sp. H23M47 TaxID=2781024 RepID=UPI00187E90B2|nr:HIT family protein [Lysobacter sp. H23M47]QOW23827.1 HIT family protein [Lysobacter sp. H23M47]